MIGLLIATLASCNHALSDDNELLEQQTANVVIDLESLIDFLGQTQDETRR